MLICRREKNKVSHLSQCIVMKFHENRISIWGEEIYIITAISGQLGQDEIYERPLLRREHHSWIGNEIHDVPICTAFLQENKFQVDNVNFRHWKLPSKTKNRQFWIGSSFGHRINHLPHLEFL